MTTTFDPRLRAILDLSVPRARSAAGRHEYDGQPQDLSVDGVRDALRRLGGGLGSPPLGLLSTAIERG